MYNVKQTPLLLLKRSTLVTGYKMIDWVQGILPSINDRLLW